MNFITSEAFARSGSTFEAGTKKRLPEKLQEGGK